LEVRELEVRHDLHVADLLRRARDGAVGRDDRDGHGGQGTDDGQQGQLVATGGRAQGVGDTRVTRGGRGLRGLRGLRGGALLARLGGAGVSVGVGLVRLIRGRRRRGGRTGTQLVVLVL